MKYFAVMTMMIGLFYLLGFLKKTEKIEFMSLEFTTAIKGFAIFTVVWAHSGARLGTGGIHLLPE